MIGSRYRTAWFTALLLAVLPWYAADRVCAQQWVRTLDGGAQGEDEAFAVATTPDADIVVAGWVDLGSHHCGALAKYSASGERRWVTNYDPFPGYVSTVGHVVAAGSGELYAAATCSDSSGTLMLAVLKLSEDGTILREFRYSHPDHLQDYPCALLLNRHGELIVVCCSRTVSTGDDVLVMRCDTVCRPVWMTRYDLIGDPNWPSSAAVDTAGDVYVVGSAIANYLTVGTVIKVTRGGDTSWTWVNGTHGEMTEFEAVGVVNDVVYVAGFRSFGRARALTVRLTEDGDTVWTRERVEGAPKAAVAIDTLGIVHTDWADDSTTSGDWRTFAYSPSGRLRWVSRYDGPAHVYDCPAAIAADRVREAIYVAGCSRGIGTSFDCTTLCYDFAGGLRWLHRYAGAGGSGQDAGQAIALDSFGNVIVAGYETGTQSGKDWLLIKYPPTGPGIVEAGRPAPARAPAVEVLPSVVGRSCEIRTRLPGARLRVVDLAGRTVRELSPPQAGTASRWDLTDEHGRAVRSGIYFVVAGQAGCAAAKVIVKR